MTKEEFDRIFGRYSETDSLTISEIRDILLYGGNGSREKDQEKFLMTSMSEYLEQDLDSTHTSLNTRLENLIKSNIITKNGNVTFADILQYGVKKLRLQRGVGKVVIDYLVQIYREHGIDVNIK